MKDEVAEVVERLRSTRSLALLRLIDDADLDSPLEPEPDTAAVVEPYRWLLARAGGGLRLTGAGYLPPSVVTEAMTWLGWLQPWFGKGNREEHTPVRQLRASAQRFGLVRKNKGQLLTTKLGRELVEVPDGLWWHLAARLPDARSEPERHAGILLLLTVAAGRSRDNALLAHGMSALGWAERDSWQPLSPEGAAVAAYDTWALLHLLGLLPERERWDEPEPPPSASAIRLARAALLGRDTSLPTPSKPKPERVLELTVTLRGIAPPIWRRLIVPAALTLHELHTVIQTAMGWQDYHLHIFDVGGVLYGDVEEIDNQPTGDEESFTVAQAAEVSTGFGYEYDLGDSWEHDIRVGPIVDANSGTPQVVDGARACPPEDCGGTPGYAHLLEVLADPTHEEHDDLLRWVGGRYDPDAFDLAATRANLELVDRQTRRRDARR